MNFRKISIKASGFFHFLNHIENEDFFPFGCLLHKFDLIAGITSFVNGNVKSMMMIPVYFLLLLFGGARISDQRTSSTPSSSSSSTFLGFDFWSNGTTSGPTHRNQRTWPVAKIHRIFNESNQTCFGTILSDRFILTAADCLRAPVDSVDGTQLQVGDLLNTTNLELSLDFLNHQSQKV